LTGSCRSWGWSATNSRFGTMTSTPTSCQRWPRRIWRISGWKRSLRRFLVSVQGQSTDRLANDPERRGL